jgi:hypothetical protein
VSEQGEDEKDGFNANGEKNVEPNNAQRAAPELNGF